MAASSENIECLSLILQPSTTYYVEHPTSTCNIEHDAPTPDFITKLLLEFDHLFTNNGFQRIPKSLQFSITLKPDCSSPKGCPLYYLDKRS